MSPGGEGQVTATRGKQSDLNLPNAISAARILMSPLIAFLPFMPSVLWRWVAFVVYLVTAFSDYFDGYFARSRGLITDLGKALDPLADKLLLVSTFLPMLVLQGAPTDPVVAWLTRLFSIQNEVSAFPFSTWGMSAVHLPWWVIAVVLGRELFMTVFRQAAQRKGVVIAAIGSAKWKAAFQYIWVGAAYCWFAVSTMIQRGEYAAELSGFVTQLLGGIGVLSMVIAVGLTLYSFVVYLRRYGGLFLT